MSLRDEILKQREDEKLQERRVEQEKQRAAQEMDQCNAQKFLDLKANLENGVVPRDWLDLYEKYVFMIKDKLVASDRFAVKEDVSEEYYLEKQNCGNAIENERTLMNKYLTKRLEDDGFKNVKFQLAEEIEKYATEGDYERQRELQAKYDERAEEKYQAECSYYAYGDTSTFPTKQCKYAELKMTGERKVYKIVVECSLYEDKKREPAKSRHRSRLTGAEKIVVSGIVGAAICLAIGIYCYVKSMLEFWWLPVLAVIGFLLISSIVYIVREVKGVCEKYKIVICSAVLLCAVIGLIIIILLAFYPELFI